MIRRLVLITSILCLAITQEGIASMKGYDIVKGFSAEQKQRLQGLRVYFGHQSVGKNIVHGIQLILQQVPDLQLRVESLDAAKPPFAPGTIVHGKIGKNTEPLSKLHDFIDKLEGGLADQVDVAIIKFCWIDFNRHTDVDALFAEYKKALDELQAAHPNLILVYATVPLKVKQGGPKAWVKKVIGKPLAGTWNNLARERFNAKIRTTYPPERIFDIARIEATKTNGKEVRFKVGGQPCRALLKEYATDEGHLNDEGAVWVAAEMLRVLSGLQPKR